jgi:hypothetical protein
LKRLNTVVTALTSGDYVVHATITLATFSLLKDKVIHYETFYEIHFHHITCSHLNQTTATSKWLNYKICHSQTSLTLHYFITPNSPCTHSECIPQCGPENGTLISIQSQPVLESRENKKLF